MLAALLLVMQLLHLQRDELATNPSLTEPLRRTYAALGMPLWPAWDLRSYEMRNSEAVADRSSPGALDILGRIAVVGNDRVGLPAGARHAPRPVRRAAGLARVPAGANILAGTRRCGSR